MVDAVRILCVHQSSELYGSDRVFIQSVKAFRQYWPQAKITVHVPEQGQLTQVIKDDIDRLITGDLFVLRLSRFHYKNWRHLLAIPLCLKKAAQNMQDHDIIYINTVMIWGYLLLTRFSTKKTVLHIHEYTEGMGGALLRFIAKWSGAKIITNSKATAKAYDNISSQVVWNGIADTATDKTPILQKPLKLLLVGRINAWKGHLIAIDAIKKLRDDGFKDVMLDIVGDVFKDQKYYYDEAVNKVKEYKLEQHIFFHGFVDDPSTFFKQAHAVLVPSIRPEPFGLVAIEGMMWSLPVIAANHGGLSEIVIHNDTGLLIQPNNADALAEAIRKYVVHESILIKHGNSGRLRYHKLFTEAHYIQRFIQAIEQCGIPLSKSF